MAMKTYCVEEVPYCFSRSSVKFRGHTAKKIVDFDPNWAFPDCISSLISPMAMKWCTKLEAAWERCAIVFQGHLSNFKVARDKKLPILTRIGCFPTVTPVWIHGWLWNDVQSLTSYRRGALLFFEVIYQISRSQAVIRLEIMPMCRPAPWMVKQWATAAGNALNWNFNGPETHAEILENEKLKQK